MAEINWDFLKHEGATDVITFQHGEIILCPEVAFAQSKEFQKSYEEELLLYVVHGWLHLCGMDDKDKASARKMRLLQEKLLQLFLRYRRHKKQL